MTPTSRWLRPCWRALEMEGRRRARAAPMFVATGAEPAISSRASSSAAATTASTTSLAVSSEIPAYSVSVCSASAREAIRLNPLDYTGRFQARLGAETFPAHSIAPADELLADRRLRGAPARALARRPLGRRRRLHPAAGPGRPRVVRDRRGDHGRALLRGRRLASPLHDPVDLEAVPLRRRPP